jgi:predicted  nucleic acid-binding Zn-ribbon protein
MDFAALFGIFQAWGPSAISSVLVLVVLYLIKKVDKNGAEDARRAESFQEQLKTRVAELRNDMSKTLEDHGRRLSYIEKEYTQNEVFFQQLSGWRTEINRLSDQINTQFMAFTQNIIQLFRGKNEG